MYTDNYGTVYLVNTWMHAGYSLLDPNEHRCLLCCSRGTQERLPRCCFWQVCGSQISDGMFANVICAFTLSGKRSSTFLNYMPAIFLTSLLVVIEAQF